MTVTVIGAWEPDWADAEKTERRQWKQTIQAYGIDNFYMVPQNQYTFTSPLQTQTVSEALDATSHYGKRVFLIPERTVLNKISTRTVVYLHDYTHPTDAVYVFGSASEDLVSHVTDDVDVVSFKTPTTTDMFGCVALGILLADRQHKLG